MSYCLSCRDDICAIPIEPYNVRDKKGRFTKMKKVTKRKTSKKTSKKK